MLRRHFDDACRHTHLYLQTVLRRMTGPGRDAGMETMEKIILGAVVIGAAVAFTIGFNTKFQEKMSDFLDAF
ncbi:hypothetical protein P8605_14165 [Streptomyces sp. T-3]|nr:hypothetical protein [Streptomyces sp. T-3]